MRHNTTYAVCGITGDPAPSAADLQITRLLRDGAKTLEIALLDHVIIGNPMDDPMGRGYYSFREAGLM
jgi:DNA repair protein RadC